MLKPGRPKKPLDELGDEVEAPSKFQQLKRLERSMEETGKVSSTADPGELGRSGIPGGGRMQRSVKFRRGGAVRDYGK